MKILVTGDTGLVGFTLCRQLRNIGHDVRGLSRHSNRDLGDKRKWNFYLMDLTDYNIDSIKSRINDFNPQVVIHCAGNPLVKVNDHTSTLDNVLATHRLLDCVPKDCHFVFTSSKTVYGNNPRKCTSDTITNPSSVYALSKLHCEKLIENYFHNNKIKSHLIFRLTRQVGENSRHGMVYDIINKLKQNTETLQLYGTRPGSKKPIANVYDTVKVMIENLDKCGTFNIAPPDNISVLEVAEIIQEELRIFKPIEWVGDGWVGDDEYVDIESSFTGMMDSESAVRKVCQLIKNDN